MLAAIKTVRGVYKVPSVIALLELDYTSVHYPSTQNAAAPLYQWNHKRQAVSQLCLQSPRLYNPCIGRGHRLMRDHKWSRRPGVCLRLCSPHQFRPVRGMPKHVLGYRPDLRRAIGEAVSQSYRIRQAWGDHRISSRDQESCGQCDRIHPCIRARAPSRIRPVSGGATRGVIANASSGIGAAIVSIRRRNPR